MIRLIAVILIFIPGVVAAIGIKLMRDSLFSENISFLLNVEIQFIVGLVLFLAGIAFIGGFVVHRDRKRNLIKKRK